MRPPMPPASTKRRLIEDPITVDQSQSSLNRLITTNNDGSQRNGRKPSPNEPNGDHPSLLHTGDGVTELFVPQCSLTPDSFPHLNGKTRNLPTHWHTYAMAAESGLRSNITAPQSQILSREISIPEKSQAPTDIIPYKLEINKLQEAFV